MKKIWSAELELEARKLRAAGLTYKQVGDAIGVTANSVKHKIRRLGQAGNEDRFKHTREKSALAAKYITREGMKVLETHSGFGGMTEFYAANGCNVECYDIDERRVRSIDAKGLDSVNASKGDSEKELLRLVYGRSKYDIVDIDPYGLPSRYFPSAFELIDGGYLFLTFPVLGVAQINKITIQHYQSFWGFIVGSDQDYLEIIHSKLHDFAFMSRRAIRILETEKIDRIYRMVIEVKKASLCDIVGLHVSRSVVAGGETEKQLDIFGGAA